MSSFLGIHFLSKSYGTQRLFKNLSFTLSSQDRIGLIGPNGAGKTTLLKILMDLEDADEGSISKAKGLQIGYSCQSPEFPPHPLEEILIARCPHPDAQIRARILLGKAGFVDFTQNASGLSGGWKKRLDIIAALMNEPDLLLLDEPTNHLDLEGILWLEKFLERQKAATLIVSHDRAFLNNVCNKIMELNPCFPQGLFVAPGNLDTFLERKEAFLAGQEQEQRGLASQLRTEIDWLRRSPAARTTKSSARIQKAHQLIEEHAELKKRNQKKSVGIEFSASERETRKLIVAKNISKTVGSKVLFKNVDITLSPGTRLGLVGKNGTGKTTLLKVLGNMMPQDVGTIKYADDLKLVYFDQHREQLPLHITLREALSPNGDMVNVRGQHIHVNGWAKKFLFSPSSLDMPISNLSGGERARILIARLMCIPADVLFLDEPTNDLDIATLEVIEESLKEFSGAVVLISHDRYQMDRVFTQILSLGRDQEQILFAGYSQWEKTLQPEVKKKEEAPKQKPTRTKKLSYNEQKELEGMEETITKLEEEMTLLQEQIDKENSLELYKRLGEAQTKLDESYIRWQDLLSKG